MRAGRRYTRIDICDGNHESGPDERRILEQNAPRPSCASRNSCTPAPNPLTTASTSWIRPGVVIAHIAGRSHIEGIAILRLHRKIVRGSDRVSDQFYIGGERVGYICCRFALLFGNFAIVDVNIFDLIDISGLQVLTASFPAYGLGG